MPRKVKYSLNLMTESNEDSEWEAEAYAIQSREWLKRCPHKERCPCARIFEYLIALDKKAKRLQFQLDIKNEWPDES